ncbi:platelet-activating factor acetylhydrolase IB subunit [Roseateles chitinivorans]|uniref:platelet-activating factor acetylhydrolase IB subunit n=1 Tax=Roseateles chitinivorans TaxID=2917965 RepID=UPI003D67D6FC
MNRTTFLLESRRLLMAVAIGATSMAATAAPVAEAPAASAADRSAAETPAAQTLAWTLPWWRPRHEAKLAEVRAMRAAGRSPQLVFIGDSITQGWEAVGQPVWAEHFARHDALNLGFSADKTENVLWRLQQGEIDGIAPKVAVLMIGTNNTGDRRDDPAVTAAGVRRVVDEIRLRLPTTKILLLAIFPRGARPDDAMRAVNTRINARIGAFADGRSVHFLDIGASLMNADGSLSPEVMPDQLHLSEKGYRLWAQAMQPTLSRLLDESR